MNASGLRLDLEDAGNPVSNWIEAQLKYKNWTISMVPPTNARPVRCSLDMEGSNINMSSLPIIQSAFKFCSDPSLRMQDWHRFKNSLTFLIPASDIYVSRVHRTDGVLKSRVSMSYRFSNAGFFCSQNGKISRGVIP